MYQPGRVLHGQFHVAVLPVPNVNPPLVRLESSHEEPGGHGEEPSQVDVGRVEPEEGANKDHFEIQYLYRVVDLIGDKLLLTLK